MIYRDVSSIPTTGCNVITSSTAITNYASISGSNTRTRVYELIGNKYIQRTDTTGFVPNNAFCQTSISTLPSNFDYIEPFYYSLALISAILIFYGAYRLVLYPFWRRNV